jgi:hypothetical protein
MGRATQEVKQTEFAMKRTNFLATALLAAGTAASATSIAAESLMVNRLAKATGLAPADVVLALGDNIAYAECQYYAHPSVRGHLARTTEQAYRRMVADRRPAESVGHDRQVSVAPDRNR